MSDPGHLPRATSEPLPPLPRVGTGVDVHALAPEGSDRALWVAGLHWPINFLGTSPSALFDHFNKALQFHRRVITEIKYLVRHRRL